MSTDLDEVRICNRCNTPKPVTEFYQKGDGHRQPMCRDCDNARPRSRTESKILRVRARHRATAELVKRHEDEFRNLLEYFTDMAQQEADLITESARAAHAPGIPRLSPGKRREGQVALDRINNHWAEVGKCPDCSTHHNHGHACTNCGTQPVPQAEPLPDLRGSCVCPHPTRRHDLDIGCLIDGCDCSGYPEDDDAASRTLSRSDA